MIFGRSEESAAAGVECVVECRHGLRRFVERRFVERRPWFRGSPSNSCSRSGSGSVAGGAEGENAAVASGLSPNSPPGYTLVSINQ